MLQLDFRSRIPVYEQLIDRIKEQIIHQVLKRDEQLPSVRELAIELTVNPNTIQKAYRELEHQGFIYSVPGKGSFVQPMEMLDNSRQKQALIEQLQKVTAELLYLGTSLEEIRGALESAGQKKTGGAAK